MQNVSTAWKAAQEQLLVPESYVEVSLFVGDPEAQQDASAAANAEEFYSHTPPIVEELEFEPTRYATLESNIWLLDGTFKILPDEAPYGEQGFVGDILSDDNGEYATTPTITISFSQIFTNLIPGITITWGTAYNEYAQDFRVTVYNDSAVVAQKEVTGNREVVSIVNMDIDNYNRIVVEVFRWCLPHRRARINKIAIAIEKKYGKAEIINYTHSMFVDPLSAALPKAEITLEIVNLNGEYNPDNPEGVTQYLMTRQMVNSRYGYKLNGEVEWIKSGTFFLSEWETPQNGITTTFTARDSLEYMTDKYTGTNTGTLLEIATSAFEQAELPLTDQGTVRWVIDSSLSEISAPSGIELGGYSIQEILQLCANAACCVFYQDREGILHIEPLADGTTDYVIGQFVSYANSEINLTKQLKAVEINNDMYTLPVGSVGETQTVTNPLIGSDRAETVAKWIADFLVNRKLLSGNFRSDPRLDALDRITNINQFAETIVLVNEITYTYNGAFRGSYEGRSGV